MKVSMHIQPSQYEFIGFEYDTEEGLSNEAIEGAISDFRRAKVSLREGTGLSEDQMDSMVQKLCSGTTIEGGTELYAQANPIQQQELQRIKRAIKRIVAKQAKS